jgi:hypothetical protein
MLSICQFGKQSVKDFYDFELTCYELNQCQRESRYELNQYQQESRI